MNCPGVPLPSGVTSMPRRMPPRLIQPPMTPGRRSSKPSSHNPRRSARSTSFVSSATPSGRSSLCLCRGRSSGRAWRCLAAVTRRQSDRRRGRRRARRRRRHGRGSRAMCRRDRARNTDGYRPAAVSAEPRCARAHERLVVVVRVLRFCIARIVFVFVFELYRRRRRRRRGLAVLCARAANGERAVAGRRDDARLVEALQLGELSAERLVRVEHRRAAWLAAHEAERAERLRPRQRDRMTARAARAGTRRARPP